MAPTTSSTKPTNTTGSPASSSLSEEEQSVLDVCHTFLDGIKHKSRAAMMATVLPECHGTLSRPDGILHLTLPAIIDRIPFDAPEQFEEPIFDPLVRIDHDLAMVWARYEFMIGGKLHHVGSNVFSLLKREGTWLISGIADTWRKPDGESDAP
jgi:hypothetical protein